MRELVLIHSVRNPHEFIVVVDLLVYHSFVLVSRIRTVGRIIVGFFKCITVIAFTVLRISSLANIAILVLTVVLTGNVSEVCCHRNLEVAVVVECDGGYRVIIENKVCTLVFSFRKAEGHTAKCNCIVSGHGDCAHLFFNSIALASQIIGKNYIRKIEIKLVAVKNGRDCDGWVNLSHGLMLGIKRCQVVVLYHFTAIPDTGIGFCGIFIFAVVEFDQRFKAGVGGIRVIDSCDLMAHQFVLIIVAH